MELVNARFILLFSEVYFTPIIDFFTYPYTLESRVEMTMSPPSVTGKVYCFPRRKLIFSFGRRVIYHSKGL